MERKRYMLKPLGLYQLRRKERLSCHFVIYKGKAKGRHHFTATGQKVREGKPSRVHANREKSFGY